VSALGARVFLQDLELARVDLQRSRDLLRERAQHVVAELLNVAAEVEVQMTGVLAAHNGRRRVRGRRRRCNGDRRRRDHRRRDLRDAPT
jgi:hypothetical protein